MSPEELRKRCHAVVLEIDSFLNSTEWDSVQTFAQSLSKADARNLYNDQRDDILRLISFDDPEDRQEYFASLPVAKRSLICFFARIAVLQAANAVSAVISATQALDYIESPIALIVEEIERSESLNENYLGLF